MRTVLLIAFGGMLVLMAVAGADALWTLHQLHEQDASTRGTWLRRGRSISQLRLSVRLYEDCARHWLMSPESPQRQEDSSGNPSDASPERLAQLAAQIHSVLQSFPEPRDKTEQALLRSFERAVAEHQKALTGTLGWKPDEIRRRGPEIMTMVVNPRQIEILELTDGMDSVNVGWLAAQDQNLLRQFEALRRRLTRLLIIALGAGLILAVGSLAYILRLEKDAERRYGEIVRNHAEMEKLSARLVDAQEQERRALSRELHDEVGQSLGALLVDLSRAAALVPADDERLKTELANLKATTEGALRSVRDIALLLRPSMLDDLGLIPALEWQAREVSRRGQMEVEVTSEGVSENLPDEYKTCIYRVAQEALHNASRHASARNAHVHVRQANGKLQISIEDDGRGFDPGTRGMGLLGMEERIKRLGGQLVIDSAPGQGTRLSAEIPLANDSQDRTGT